MKHSFISNTRAEGTGLAAILGLIGAVELQGIDGQPTQDVVAAIANIVELPGKALADHGTVMAGQIGHIVLITGRADHVAEMAVVESFIRRNLNDLAQVQAHGPQGGAGG